MQYKVHFAPMYVTADNEAEAEEIAHEMLCKKFSDFESQVSCIELIEGDEETWAFGKAEGV